MSHATRKRRNRRGRGGAARLVILAFAAVMVLIVAVGATGAAYVSSIADGVDLDQLARKDPGAQSVVYAADGEKLGYLEGDVLRAPVSTGRMSQYVRDATVAVEDRRFYEHGGVDVEGIFRAATKNLSAGGTVEGASTLEMQLIRNLYTENDAQNYKRKIREAKLADQLEKRHPGRRGKQWVLTTYLNTAPYGNSEGGRNIKGVQAAARVYFNTTAAKLTLAQAAMIAGLPQAPTQYNPFLHPKQARARRNDVLRRMAAQHKVSAAAAAAAERRSLGLKPNRYYTTRHEQYFVDYVRSLLIKKYGSKRVSEGGLKVYTTIDLKKQDAARKAIANHSFGEGGPSSAIASIDPRTGNIVAAASSAAYGTSQFDLAIQGHRQPGSTFKVMVLTAALEQGVDPESTTYPAPSTFPIPPQYGTGVVRNFAGEGGGGSMNLVTATLKSVNTVFFQLDLDVGPANVTKAAREMGITSYLGNSPAEGIGGLRDGVSPLEMARAYASLATGGKKVTPRAITKVDFPDGRVSHPQPIRREQTFSKGVASEVTRILEKDIQGGTASAANFGCPAAGKTGTTDGPSDVWLVGYTPRLSTATWVGYPKTRQTIPGGNVQGATYAAPIWKDFMAAAHGGFCGGFTDLAPFSGTKGRPNGGAGSRGAPDAGDGTSTGPGDPTGTGDAGSDSSGNGGSTADGGSFPSGSDGGPRATRDKSSHGVSAAGTGHYPKKIYESPPSTVPRH